MKKIALIAMLALAAACSANAQVTTQRVDGALLITDSNPGVKADMPSINNTVSPHAACSATASQNAGQGVTIERCTQWTFGAPTKFAATSTPRSAGFQSLNPR